MKEEEITEILKETGALWEGHFLLTSGRHSPFYIQCALLLQYPQKAAYLLKELAAPFKEEKIEAVVGPATGGIIPAYELARQLSCRALFTEREAGKMTLRRGFKIEAGEKVLAVEDVVTTGGSLQETIEVLKERGAEVIGAVAIVDRSSKPLSFSVPFTALLKLDIPSYEAQNCPLCAEGLPFIKPGSRSK